MATFFYYIHLRAEDLSMKCAGYEEDQKKRDEQTALIKNVPTAQGKKSIQTLH